MCSCLPSAILLQPFPQWLDVGVAGRIMLLAFTRRASDEMLRRARRALGETGSRTLGTVWGGTFHSVANRLLRTYGEAIGLDPDFTVMDQSDAEDLMDASRHNHALGSKGKRFPRKQTCLSIYSRCVNSSDRLDHTHERFDHILVDEYQDTNRLQFSILHRMRALDRNLTVVGDDAQSIYSFRAAEVRKHSRFPRRISRRDGWSRSKPTIVPPSLPFSPA